MAHGSEDEVARVKEGNVAVDEIMDDSNSAYESNEDEEGVV